MLGGTDGSVTGTGNIRYGMDAWGRPKYVHDHSLFSATWTFGIPARVWEEYNYDGDTTTWAQQVGFANATASNKTTNATLYFSEQI